MINESTIDSQTFLNLTKRTTHSEVVTENIHANIILIMLVVNFFFLLSGKNVERTSNRTSILQKS